MLTGENPLAGFAVAVAGFGWWGIPTVVQRLGRLGLVAAAAGLGGWAMAYAVFQGPTELIQYDPAKASPGYTLFSPFRGQNTYLIDMHGNVVHYWPYPDGWSTPGAEAIEKHARLLEDGTLLRGAIDRAGRGGMSGAIYQLYDWDGNVIWEHDEERPGYTPHHDFRMIWNPKLGARTLLYVASKEITHEQAIALGVDPARRDDYASRPDGVVEVDMDGNVIWEWNITDHLIQDIEDTLPNFGVVAEHPGKMDPNFAGGASGDWIHINSLDYNQTLDHIAINNSTFSESYVIDHGGTFVAGDPERSIALAASDAGDFLHRWGNPCVYDAGECPRSINEGQSSTNGHQQVFFSHDIQWIRERETGMGDDLPGAGNMLIFNNGSRQLGVTFSSVIEFNPYDGPMENGVYVPEMEAGHDPAARHGRRRTRLQTGRLELPVNPADGLLQPLHLRHATVAQRQHAGLLGRQRAPLRGHFRGRGCVGVRQPRGRPHRRQLRHPHHHERRGRRTLQLAVQVRALPAGLRGARRQGPDAHGQDHGAVDAGARDPANRLAARGNSRALRRGRRGPARQCERRE